MHPDTEHAVGTAELVDLLDVATVGTAEAALVSDGACVPLTVHLLSWRTESPYVGYVITRPVTDGHDAAAAIAAIGALPATMRARELVVAWEHSELSTSLGLPGGPLTRAIAVVAATLEGHEVRWHPFDVERGPAAPSGRPTLIPAWGRAWRERDAELPAPVVELLAQWRAGRDPRELRWVCGRLQSEGYTVHWMKPSVERATEQRQAAQ